MKYDADTTLLSLNKARPHFPQHASDDIRAHLETPHADWQVRAAANPWIAHAEDGLAISVDNHVFRIAVADEARVAAIEYLVEDPARSRAFFEASLDLPFQDTPDGGTQAGTATMLWRFRRRAGTAAERRSGLFLTVLHAPDLRALAVDLAAREVVFLTPPQSSQIGWTVRFTDPDGHHFCLYEPSAESLTWESGQTLRRLIAGASRPRGRSRPQASGA